MWQTASSSKPRTTTSFRKSRVIAPLHTGGPIAITHDAQRIVTCIQEDVLFTDVESGVEISRLQGDTTSITSLCISPTSKHLIVFTSSLFLRIYELPLSSEKLSSPVAPTRTIPRAHDAPVHVSTVDPTSSYIASGSADGIVKVWDLIHGYVTHVFKGHGGVVSALAFHYCPPQQAVDTPLLQLITGSVDTRIRIFNLAAARSRTGRARPDIVLQGHVSVPRGISVSNDGKWLVTGGRDAVVLVWDLSGEKGKPSLVRTIPVLERIEALGILPTDQNNTTSKPSSLKLYTGGDQGTIKIWDAWEGNVVATMTANHNCRTRRENDPEEQREVVDILYVTAAKILVSIHADQNILFHSLETNALVRQLIGYNDEITDATFLQPGSFAADDSHLALSTNSSLIRVYSMESYDARLLYGHNGIVLSLDKSAGGRVLVSGSKDCTARIWAYSGSNESESSQRWGCVAVCAGHAESVGAVAMARSATDTADCISFMFTGSQDRTIKMWDLSSVPLELALTPEGEEPEPLRLNSLVTHLAHDKDINSLDVAPTNRLLVSGSQDKTAKLFQIKYALSKNGSPQGEIRLLGVLKGHKRGIWSVRFSKTEKLLATGSGDKTVKLWSVDDFTCLKTFEGHTNSVLRINFISQGRQLLSTASDGLLKLWNVQNEECMATMDNHEDKVWALAVGSTESIVVSAGADSVVTFWQDSTKELELDKEKKRTDMVIREQDLANYVSLHDYRNAIQLALVMDHPGRLLSLFLSARSSTTEDDVSSKSITGNLAVDQVLETLPLPSLARLLFHVRAWNASARTSSIAQTVLHAVLKLRPAEDITAAFESYKVEKKDDTSLQDLVEGMIPYTERHLVRVEKLVQDSWVIDFVLGEMDGGLTIGDDTVDVMDVDRLLPQ